MRKFILLFFSLSIASSGLLAQKNVVQQHLLWTRYFLSIKFNETLKVRSEFEDRAYWFPWRQHQLLYRMHLEKAIGKGWRTAAGMAWILQNLPHDPEVKDITHLSELRPQLEIANKVALSPKFYLSNRYWV